MKHSYIQPSILIVKLGYQKLISTSLNIYADGTGDGTDLVKEDISSKPYRYNVWDDDWSE